MIIVLQAAVVFVLLWFVVRVVGKRELSQMSAFDLVLLVVIGDLIAEGVISEDTSVTGAVIAVATFALLTVGLSWLAWRFPRAEKALEGVPTLLIKNGVVLEEALNLERVTITDLHEAARQEGIRDLDDVEWAVLEQDGTFSFFERDS
ncbi:DUF421 domain-containing protein [Nocardioides massiliensis]|uniref:Uncharacterized membrane protein YcaP (DUF421 family) n=1 Tax=Nocardioides massiliensis TaxID=1325935 RepID=A0ABT9NL30_9ACTN|nr:YetF domain-containing protein [Nocardioides massiliensis]MDP9821127.1 uncharacterized membrane protein YcaP (DUF421 family) [Nocardioides massiliensis]